MSAESSVQSNAFNFGDFLSDGVDPRTGHYAASLPLPSFCSGDLAGPSLPLTLGYSPLNGIDGGFGKGWSLNLTRFSPQNHNVLSTGGGETYKVEVANGLELPARLAEQKFKSFNFYAQSLGSGPYRVVHRSGLAEVLTLRNEGSRRIALPSQIIGPLGHALTLEYTFYKGTLALRQILDQDMQVLLRIDYLTSQTRVTLAPEAPTPGLLMVFDRTADLLTSVTMPGIEGGAWALSYQRIRGYDCLANVKTPQGGEDRLEYNDAGHAFPGGGREPLPRVTRHQRYPGLSQPPLETRWTYSPNNYLGNGALQEWVDNGTDQLYQATDDNFRYWSQAAAISEGQQVRTLKRSYNRFHQMVEEYRDQRGHVLMQTVEYHLEPGKPFDDQPVYCQMPKRQTTRWRLPGGAARQESSERSFNTRGLPIWEKGADGIEVSYEYYPPEGEGLDCPPDPYGFGQYIKRQIITPASMLDDDALPVETRYRYRSLPALAGSDQKGLVLPCEEVQWQLTPGEPTLLARTEYQYFDSQRDRLLHGRLSLKIDTVNGLASTTHFTYSTQNTVLGEALLIAGVEVRGHDGTVRTAQTETLTLNGLEVTSTDADGVVLRHAYDALNRTTVESVEGPNGEHKAQRRYEYRFAGPGGAGNDEITVDVNGVRSRTVSDGAGRVVAEHRKVDDQSPERLLGTQLYNGLGQQVQAVVFDDFDEGQEVALTSEMTYDDWGNLYSHCDPAKRLTITHSLLVPGTDAVSALESWVEHPDAPGERRLWSYSEFNRFGKPELEQRREADGSYHRVVGETRYRYDGLGRCVEQTQDLGENGERRTGLRYDGFGRTSATERPDGSELQHRYAAHSAQPLPTALALRQNPLDEGESPTLAGEQRFDGLGRLVERTVGTLVERFHYREGATHPYQRTQPSGHVSSYQYIPSLASTPTEIRDDTGTQRFDYHPLTGQVTGAQSDDGSQTAFAYDALGEVQRQQWRAPDNSQHETRFSQSRLGRRLTREDDAAPPSQYRYDAAGRPCEVVRGALVTTCRYDAFGQVVEVNTTGPTETSRCTREYDAHGRETLRRLYLPGVAELTIGQRWSDDDMPLERTYASGGEERYRETFEYDEMGRLAYCEYSGDPAWFPQDRFGTPIEAQAFMFDLLGNLLSCRTDLSGAAAPVYADYSYAEHDPCRLLSVQYSPASYAPAERFAYDANGCLLNDSQGHGLTYDARGRLTGVDQPDGTALTRYRYDPHDALAGTTDAGGHETRWYYEGLAPHHSETAGTTRQYLYDLAGQPAAEHLSSAHEPLLLAADPDGGVRAEYQNGQVREARYGAYGETSAQTALASTLGYNGERREAGLDAYLLGQGYRVYLPGLRRFNAPDSASPFDGGGLNPYTYAAGNPIVYGDPTGHYVSTLQGPERILLPAEPEGPSALERWLPVAFSVVMAGISFFLAPPAAIGWMAFSISAAVSTVSISYNALVAAQVIEGSGALGTIIMIVDIGVGMATGSLGRSAVKASAKATKASVTVVPRPGDVIFRPRIPRVPEPRYIRRPLRRFFPDDMDMEVFKTGRPPVAKVKKTVSSADPLTSKHWPRLESYRSRYPAGPELDGPGPLFDELVATPPAYRRSTRPRVTHPKVKLPTALSNSYFSFRTDRQNYLVQR